MGIMITASHNPHTDNGIKLLNLTGAKLDVEIEQDIEFIINNNDLSFPKIVTKGKKYFKIAMKNTQRDTNFSFLKT